MHQKIMTAAEVKDLIEQKKTLLVAGDEAILAELPKGNWIGGTIPYFITHENGGIISRDKIFVTDVSPVVSSVFIKQYDADTIKNVYLDGPDNGFSIIIIPSVSRTHLSFAMNSPTYENFGVHPLIGWISGVHLEDLGQKDPKIFNGQTSEALSEGALVLQATLPPGMVAEVGIVNPFQQGDGDILRFEQDGFSVKDVLVNGKKRNFAQYMIENKLDIRLPLVADYYGVMINTSIQGIDDSTGEVQLYAPVFKDILYKHAKPVDNYVEAFQTQLHSNDTIDQTQIAFSCNCILNYLYSELEGKKTEPFAGPVTFGEIAYQLVNQTLAYLTIHPGQ